MPCALRLGALSLGILGALALGANATAQELERLEPRGGKPVAASVHIEGAMAARPAALLFASFDRNADYAVDADELAQGLTAAFASADGNGDFLVTPLEYAEWAEKALGARDALPTRLRLDANGDGSLEEWEFIEGYRAQAALYRQEGTEVLRFADLAAPIAPRPDPSRDGPIRLSDENANGSGQDRSWP